MHSYPGEQKQKPKTLRDYFSSILKMIQEIWDAKLQAKSLKSVILIDSIRMCLFNREEQEQSENFTEYFSYAFGMTQEIWDV